MTNQKLVKGLVFSYGLVFVRRTETSFPLVGIPSLKSCPLGKAFADPLGAA